MKSPSVLLAAALLTLTLPATAEIIGLESFDYPNGALAGKNGGTFWDYQNISPAGRSGTASVWSNLSGTPAVTSGQLVTSGNGAVRRAYNGNTETTGAISDANVAKTVFYKVNVTTGPSVSAADYFGISSMEGSAERFYFGKRGGFNAWGVEEVGLSGTNSTLAVLPNQIYTLVAQVDLPGDRIRLYVNPTLTELQFSTSNNNALAANRIYAGTAASTAVRFAAGTAVSWDNLVVATTWEDLSPPTIVNTTVDEDNLSNSNTSLREAVKYSPEGRTITFAPALSGQTITLTHPDADLLVSKSLTIDASSLSTPPTVSGNLTTRHFFVQTGKNLTLRNLRLTSGRDNQGASIYNSGTLTLSRCALLDNRCVLGAGGGIYNNVGTLLISDSDFTDNFSPLTGGAIHNLSGNVQISTTAFAGNSTFTSGGAIQNTSGTVTIATSSLSGNTSDAGAAIHSTGTLQLTSSTVSGNTASSGGGVHTSGNFTATTSTIAGNNATFGGGIYFAAGTLNLTSCTISANTAATAGGGIQNDTFAPFPMDFCIVAGNTATNFNGTLPTSGTNLTSGDPLLSPLGDYGGLTLTMPPTVNSPAVDAGGTLPPTATDQRGLARLVDGNANGTAEMDLGAVELVPMITTVTLATDEDDGANSLNPPADISLREAVKYSPTGSLITFAPGLSGQTITLTLGQLLIDKSFNIDASTLARGITIDANGAVTNHRVMQINPNTTVTLRGLTLTGGKATGGVPASVGGAIYADGSGSGNSVRLTLMACTLSGNSAASFGGGIGCESRFSGSATLSLIACTLAGNLASEGGGIFSNGFQGNATTLSLNACTLTGNLASTSGGGIFSEGQQGSATLILHNTILAANTAPTGSDLLGVATITTGTGSNLMSSIAGSFPEINPANVTITADPKLSPLGHFGGPVQTLHPLIGSPAIDAAGTTNPGGTDARGFPRFVDGNNSAGDQLDIGAVEAGPLFNVSNSSDVAGLTLRLLLDNVANTPGVRIGFASTVFPAATILLGSQLTIPATANGIFIDASNLSAPATISGNNQFRVFNIPATATVAMHSLNIVNGNAGDSAGGGILNAGTCTVISSTLSGNEAFGGSGGGISNSGTCTVLSSTLSGNKAPNGTGGGIFNSGTCTVMSSTLSGNEAFNGTGGGISNFGTCTVLSSTLSGNSADSGGGGIFTNGAATPFHLTASIVAGNDAPTGPDIDGFLTPGGPSNLFGPANPLLAPLGDYGGPTQTMPPLPGSPAIDAASATAAQTDQRGFPRSRDGDGNGTPLPDIGAVEAGLIAVTIPGDSGPGSLRAALTEAAAQPGADIVYFTPAITTHLTLASEILISDSAGITLDATDRPTGLVIDAGPGTNRHFRIAAGTTAVFNRLRLYGGNGGGAETNDIGHGGSIRNEGTLTLRECMIADCTSPNFGGALYNTNPGTLTLERSTLYGNSASAGGGAIQQVSPNLLTLNACTVANNRAGFEAGGINAPFGPASLIHSTITGNTVVNPGSNGVGGLRGGALTVSYSLIAGNTDANFPGIPNISPNFIYEDENFINGDAKLAPLGDYGGPTWTMPPIPGSLAIDNAYTSTAPTDQRGFPRNGTTEQNGLPRIETADLGAAEYRGTADARLYWLADWDGDGQTFGIEHALGTDALRSDRGNTRNLTAPVIDALGSPQLTFGLNNAATFGTQWRITRSTDLVNFAEIFRYDGTAYTFVPAQINIIDNGTSITVIDRLPPAGKAFYRFEAIAP